MLDTRRRILEVALEAFSRHGYRQTDVAQVAETAGLSRQGLYRHFASKDVLFEAVVKELHETTLAAAAAATEELEAAGAVAVLTGLLERRLVPFFERIYASGHAEELLNESNSRCAALNAAASRRFFELLVGAVGVEERRGRLDLRRAGLDESTLAELLLRAANGLKTPSPTPLLPSEFRARLAQMVALLCASVVVGQEPELRRKPPGRKR